ncbi:MAG: hypothetical protein WC329_05105, partial [Candidatus Omnitrophota bacterium]
MARTKRQPLYVGDVTGSGGGGGGAGVWDPAGTAAAAVAAHELAYNHHSPVTLSAAADVLLSLSTQEIGLDNQNANRIFAGPAAGAAAAPTFRAMVEADLGTTLIPTFAGVNFYSGGAGVQVRPNVSASESSLHVTSSQAATMAGLRIYPESGVGTGAGYGATYEFYASGYPGAASFQRLVHVATTAAMYICSDRATAAAVPIKFRCGNNLWSSLADAMTIGTDGVVTTHIGAALAGPWTAAGTLSGNLAHAWATWQMETRYNASWYWGMYFDEPTRKLTIQNQSNDSGGDIYLVPSAAPSVGYVYSADLRLPKAGTAYRLPVYSGANVMTELAAAGATGEYLKGNTGAIPSWATLNQAAVDGLKETDSPTLAGLTVSGLTASLPVVTSAGKALASMTYADFKTNLSLAQADISGLTTASSPAFVTVKCSGLDPGYVPYHVSDAAGLADSPLRSTAADLGMGMAPTTNVRLSIQATASCEATLGAEMLTNGDFATNDFTGWTAGANWDAATGAAVHTAGSVETLVQAVNLTNAEVYQVSVTVVRTAGSVTITFGALGGGYAVSSSSTLAWTWTATGTAAFNLTVTPSSDFAGSVVSVTCKLVTANATPIVAFLDSAGSDAAPLRASYALGNIGLGYAALRANTTGYGNSAMGYAALYANTTGYGNSAMGYAALRANTTGYYSSAMGYAALYANTTGYGNSAMGYAALYANTTGYGNS